MRSEAAEHADFQSVLRYAQCWEDADILLEGLDIQPGDTCLSVASAGDNTLSLLTRFPARVIAIDLNPAQLAALELRVAAYRTLSHAELLELIGSRPSTTRTELYAKARAALSTQARSWWDVRPGAIRDGIGGAGKFESYLSLFRRLVLPLVHSRALTASLLERRSAEERIAFYDTKWDTPIWRSLFRAFFSQTVLGRLGRDPSFFRYAEGSVAEHLLARTKHALATLEPAENPYAHWILLGTHGSALPHALRPESFDVIRENLDRLEWHCKPLESVFENGLAQSFDRANLSNVFEYVSEAGQREMLNRLADVAAPGARIAYWNMMVPRSGERVLPDRIRTLTDLSQRLFALDKAFFYRAFVVEKVIC
ncbi:MAG: DUF3419 family protein [Gemmatimonadaceae bacterium]